MYYIIEKSYLRQLFLPLNPDPPASQKHWWLPYLMLTEGNKHQQYPGKDQGPCYYKWLINHVLMPCAIKVSIY